MGFFYTESLILKEVLIIVKECESDWEKLATLLGLKKSFIDNIKANRRNNTAELCLTAVISEWLTHDYGASREQLQQVMRNLQQPELVSHI